MTNSVWGSIVFLLFFHLPVAGQGYGFWSVNADLAVLLSKDETYRIDAFTLTKSEHNLEYGFNILRRRFINNLSPISIEYGLGIDKSSYSLSADSPNMQLKKINIDQFDVSTPIRVFYGGTFTKNRSKRQSGLFVEAIPFVRFGNDILRPLYDVYLGLGARTRGRHFYYQIAFDWRLLSTKTYLTLNDRTVSFRDRARRAGLLTIGYQFP